MCRLIIFRHIGNSVAVCILKGLHISCDRIPGLQFSVTLHDRLIFQIFNGIPIPVLRFKRQQSIGHFHHRTKHLAGIQICHNMIQLVILDLDPLSVCPGEITICHLIQDHPMWIVCKIQSTAI